jgi:hypothetical protein
VLANSSGVAKSLVEYDHLNPSRVIVVPNFLEDDAFEAPSVSAILKWRREFQITPQSLVLGIVASLRAVKDHQTFFCAVAQLVERWPLLRVVVHLGSPAFCGARAKPAVAKLPL